MARRARVSLAIAGGVAIAGLAGIGLWWRRHGEDHPYGPRWISDNVPRPGISRGRLVGLLALQPEETVLEVGPGYGYYSVTVARMRQPAGTLELLDVHRTLLDQSVARAAGQGLTNVSATLGDGRRLPYPDERFDAAFLVATLGEIGDDGKAIAELARVLRPGGRLVVGETVFDPHRVRPWRLSELALDAGLRPGPTVGRKSYVARYEKPR
jgi:SAM-dependent methyltransferase